MVFESDSGLSLLDLDDRITEGGAAMMASARIQFDALAEEEQENFYVK